MGSIWIPDKDIPALNEIIARDTFPSFLLFEWKMRSHSSEIFIYSLHTIHCFAWPFTFKNWFLSSLLIFSQVTGTMNWDVILVQLVQMLLKDLWESSVLSRFLPAQREEFDFDFFFSLRLQFFFQRYSQV